uniref:Uncharacterized protein n=1 Tax=Parascaris univalens TaxID=6257 RepID=A0A915CK78_PARUN
FQGAIKVPSNSGEGNLPGSERSLISMDISMAVFIRREVRRKRFDGFQGAIKVPSNSGEGNLPGSERSLISMDISVTVFILPGSAEEEIRWISRSYKSPFKFRGREFAGVREVAHLNGYLSDCIYSAGKCGGRDPVSFKEL